MNKKINITSLLLLCLYLISTTYTIVLSQNISSKFESEKNKPKSLTKLDNLHYNIGILLAEKHDFESALKEFDTALTINPQNTFALYARATVYYQTEKLKESLSDLNALFKLEKKNIKAISLRAEVNQLLENYVDAIHDHELIMKLEPKNANNYLRLAFCYQLTNDPEKAIKNYLTAEKLGADNDELLINLSALFYQTREYDKSLEYIDKANKKGISNNDLYSLKIYNLLEKSLCTDAESVFNKHLGEIESHGRILMNLGICFLNQNEFSKAKNLFERSLLKDTSLIENAFNIGVACLKSKQIDSSLVKFEEFMKLSEKRNDLEKLRIEAQNQIDYLKDFIKKEKANWKVKDKDKDK